MNARDSKTRQSNATKAPKHHESLAFAEGVVRLVLAVVVILMIIWLVVKDPILSSNAQLGVKALMAFAFAVLMSSMAGLVEIKGKHLGWVVRAAGGGAIFVIVWFTLPKIIGTLERRPVAHLGFGELSAFDARSMKQPTDANNAHGDSGLALTIPVDLTATSTFDSSLPAVLRDAEVTLALNGFRTRLPWQYFVRQIPYTDGGNWLSADPVRNAQAIEVSVGSPVKQEVMFASSPGEIDWKTFLSNLADGGVARLKVTWSLSDAAGSRSLEQVCEVSGRTERPIIQAKLKNGRMPSRIVFQCGK